MTKEKKMEVAEEILNEEKQTDEQNKMIDRSIDKILIAHRNTKLFLFMMSGPFFITMTIIKYSIKAFIIYFLY